MTSDAVIIEVGQNEQVPRAAHPQVPITPQEIADDARRCRDAGASVVHWHARDPETGAGRLADAALYGAMLEALRGCDVLAYPTYPVEPDHVDGRLGHCWELRGSHGLEIVPIDVASVTSYMWDAERHAVHPNGVIANPLEFTLAALGRARQLGLTPTFAAFDLGATRSIALLADAGEIHPPVFLKIFLSSSWAIGPFPSEEALDLHLRQLPADLDVAWVLVPYSMNDPALVERLSRAALDRGGGIRVGIGDNAAAYPGTTNAALVDQAAKWADAAGRAVATSTDTRTRLGITT